MDKDDDFLGVNLQAWIIVLILTVLAFWYFLSPAYGQDVYVEKSIPREYAVSVVMVTQCGNAIGFYATMGEGRLLAFDKSSNVDFKATLEWGQKAKRSITVDAECRMDGIAT